MRGVMLAVILGGFLGASGAGAQERVVVQGTVQWISGTAMAVFADTGLSVRVDLNQVDQSTYNALRHNDRVVVIGVVTQTRDRLIAEAVVGNPLPTAAPVAGPPSPRAP